MRTSLSKLFLPLLILFIASFLAFCEKEESSEIVDGNPEYIIHPDKLKTSPVSNKLLGFNLIYPHEKNIIWQDGKIANYLKDVNVAFLRYPGGTVCSYYHWNSLTGEGWKDNWDPQNVVPVKDPSQFMDIDEYMTLVKNTGATPLVGINMSSGWRWNRMEDGIKEAISLMQYCKDKNFKVEYWYLDNEPYQHDSNGGSKTPDQYGQLINAFATAMKAIDPNIKIVVNWNSGFKNKRAEYETLLKVAGANIDIIDAHWYWSWSNASWTRWLEKTPMQQWTGFTYAEDISYFRQMVKELGFPNIQLASFEWNTGPTKNGSFTPSQIAMTQAEMMMQFISGGLDYAVSWPIQWPDESSKIRSFVNNSNNAANPVYHLYKFLGKMQGGLITSAEITATTNNMVTLAVKDADSKFLRICVLNKNQKEIVTEIRLDQFPEFKFKEAQVYTVSGDGNNYSLESVNLLESEDKKSRVISRPISFTMITFEQRN